MALAAMGLASHTIWYVHAHWEQIDVFDGPPLAFFWTAAASAFGAVAINIGLLLFRSRLHALMLVISGLSGVLLVPSIVLSASYPRFHNLMEDFLGLTGVHVYVP